jgi:hypothetical protein
VCKSVCLSSCLGLCVYICVCTCVCSFVRVCDGVNLHVCVRISESVNRGLVS